jgi:hypothetical protein
MSGGSAVTAAPDPAAASSGAASLPPARLRPAVDLARRLGGLLVAALLGVLTAVQEALLTPLTVHWGSAGQHWARLPIALVAALVINPVLAWYAYRTTRRLGAMAVPAVGWIVVMLAAAMKTTEGDLILSGGNWVSVATIFGGALGFAVGAMALSYRTLPSGRTLLSGRTLPSGRP